MCIQSTIKKEAFFLAFLKKITYHTQKQLSIPQDINQANIPQSNKKLGLQHVSNHAPKFNLSGTAWDHCTHTNTIDKILKRNKHEIQRNTCSLDPNLMTR